MTDLLLMLWLIFGSLYALNIAICLVSLHINAKNPVPTGWLIRSTIVSSITTIVFFPLNMFGLTPASTKAISLYKILSEGYKESQKQL